MKQRPTNQLSLSISNLFLVAALLISSAHVDAKKRNRHDYQPRNPPSSEGVKNPSDRPQEDNVDHSQENNSGSNNNDRNPGYPKNPEDSMTPGSLCTNASEYRYPEKIKYCNRDVESDLKRVIIQQYDRQFGYRIQQMNRGDFKIDHLIPLCAGGSNEQDNLWPQHKSVYVKTDRIEESLCRLMASGRLSQAKAIELILDVKHHLEKADRVLADLLSQLN